MVDFSIQILKNCRIFVFTPCMCSFEVVKNFRSSFWVSLELFYICSLHPFQYFPHFQTTYLCSFPVFSFLFSAPYTLVPVYPFVPHALTFSFIKWYLKFLLYSTKSRSDPSYLRFILPYIAEPFSNFCSRSPAEEKYPAAVVFLSLILLFTSLDPFVTLQIPEAEICEGDYETLRFVKFLNYFPKKLRAAQF